MPNLPENFDPKDWEICFSPIAPENQGFIQKSRNLFVKHIPTGTKSRTIWLSGELFHNPNVSKAIMQQQVNRLILEVFPIIDPRRSKFYDWIQDDQWHPLENQKPDFKPTLAPAHNNTASAHKKRKFNLD